ncbi:hypothetical protein TELCIR_11207 [Teladorsagia circumcincta]|uniref:Uncharacterized protein n=1 Tax=Teladorsagia circumcincta TaxID=45464 RepID=A0A2G9U9X0_TELCI|nr:hypothetical protein TELCIR_11207 [Teladorsagia circumcincta]
MPLAAHRGGFRDLIRSGCFGRCTICDKHPTIFQSKGVYELPPGVLFRVSVDDNDFTEGFRALTSSSAQPGTSKRVPEPAIALPRVLANGNDSTLRALTSGSAQPGTSRGLPERAPALPRVSADGNDCTEDPTVTALASDNTQPTSSKEVAQDGNPAPRPRYYMGPPRLSGPIFHGVLEASRKGVHPVQNESEFIGDPAELPHVCTPLLNAKDRVQRIMYQSCRAIAMDPTLAGAKPSQLWKSVAELIDKSAADDDVLRNEMRKQFYKSGYKIKSKTIARAAARLRRAAVGNATNGQGGEAPKSKTEDTMS